MNENETSNNNKEISGLENRVQLKNKTNHAHKMQKKQLNDLDQRSLSKNKLIIAIIGVIISIGLLAYSTGYLLYILFEMFNF